MDPLVQYYLHQAGRGYSGGKGCIWSIYSVPITYQRGNGIGSFFAGLWRMVKPILWSSAKTVGRETLRTGGKILTDMADKSAGTPGEDIVAKHARELIGKLKGGGRKRKAKTAAATAVMPKKKRAAKESPHARPQNVHIETFLPNRHHLHSRPRGLQS